MSSKFMKIILVAILINSLAGQANAALIEGEIYTNADGVLWEYVGSYDMLTGPAWDGTDNTITSDNATPFNALEAAVAAGVTNVSLANIAIAAFDQNETLALKDVLAGANIVNHLAWYDGAETSIAMFNENLVADGNADGKYTQGVFASGLTDRSAWVNDRAIENKFVNHVFKRVTEVPAPYSFAIFAFALFHLVARQTKR